MNELWNTNLAIFGNSMVEVQARCVQSAAKHCTHCVVEKDQYWYFEVSRDRGYYCEFLCNENGFGTIITRKVCVKLYNSASFTV